MVMRYRKKREKKYMNDLLNGRHYLQGYVWLLAGYVTLGRRTPSEIISHALDEDEGGLSHKNDLPIVIAEEVFKEDALVSVKVKDLKNGESSSSTKGLWKRKTPYKEIRRNKERHRTATNITECWTIFSFMLQVDT